MDDHNQLVGAVAVRQVRVRPRATCGEDEPLTRESDAVCYDYDAYDRSPLVVNGTTYEWTEFDGCVTQPREMAECALLSSRRICEDFGSIASPSCRCACCGGRVARARWGETYGSALWKPWEIAERTRSLPYGRFESPIWRAYPFDGFVEYLPARDAAAAANTLAWMRDHEWLNASASAVFVDYTVLNPSLQRLIAVELVIELPETGLAFPRSRVVVLPRLDWLHFRFEHIAARVGAWTMVCFVMLNVIRGLADEAFDFARLVISALNRIQRHGYGARLRFTLLRVGLRLVVAGAMALNEYLDDIYNFFDIIAASLIVGWFYSWVWMVLRARELDVAVDAGAAADDPRGAEYYALNERIVPLLQQANDLISLGIFFSYLKVIKHIRLLPVIGPSVQAVSATIANLRVMTFLLFFLFFTLSFTVGVNIAFGGQLAIYEDLFTAFLSVFAQQLGDSALEDM